MFAMFTLAGALRWRLTVSLRSKRFRGVFCTEKPIFEFLDTREMGRERKQSRPNFSRSNSEERHGNACFAGWLTVNYHQLSRVSLSHLTARLIILMIVDDSFDYHQLSIIMRPLTRALG